MEMGDGVHKMSVQDQISKLNPWFYEVNISGFMTTPGIYPLKRRLFNNKGLVDSEYLINRQVCRSNLLLDLVMSHYDFTDKNLLDVGCNCCYWSSRYLSCGASTLVAIDGRELFIKQAELLLSSLGYKGRYHLITDNVEEVDYPALPHTPFDFILCAGILYHLRNYKDTLKRLSKVNVDCMVIDTRVTQEDTPFKEPRDLYFNAIEETRNKQTPSQENLLGLLHDFDYKYEILKPNFPTVKGVEGADNYNLGNRICILCRKVS